MNYIELGWWDLAAASVLVLANAALSFAFQLGLGRRVLVAAARMAIQLSLIGLVLKALFAVVSPFWTLATAIVMIGFAGREVRARQQRALTGPWGYGIGALSILLASTLVTVLALTTQIRPDPWYDPRYTIPILGMILGNTMTGVSLGLNTLTETAVTEADAIEARLALGHRAVDALRPLVRRALHDGCIPIVNAMSAAGIVSLPGMMTGQILAGASPQGAIKYQILIMFLISGATTLGVLAAVALGTWRLTDRRQRLRLDRVERFRET